MNKIIIDGEEIEVKNGYPMFAPFMFFNVSDIENAKETTIEDAIKVLKASNDKISEKDKEFVDFCIKNLEDPTKIKIISTEIIKKNERSRIEIEIDKEELNDYFFILHT